MLRAQPGWRVHRSSGSLRGSQEYAQASGREGAYNRRIEGHFGNRMKIKSIAAPAGFTLVEIMIVCSLIGMLAAIAIPNFIRARQSSQTNVCINNLRQIHSAIQTWAMETKKGANSPVVEDDVLPYLKNRALCPAGGTTFANSYELTDVATDPACRKVAATHLLNP